MTNRPWLEALVDPESIDKEAQATIEGHPPTPRYLDSQKTVAAVLDLEDQLDALDAGWVLDTY